MVIQNICQLYGFNMWSNMKVCRNIQNLNQFLRIPFAQDLRFFSKIPDSNWNSKHFVLDSSWCRAPRANPTIKYFGDLFTS